MRFTSLERIKLEEKQDCAQRAQTFASAKILTKSKFNSGFQSGILIRIAGLIRMPVGSLRKCCGFIGFVCRRQSFRQVS